ncbi:MAG: phosphoribosylformylglycinamidine synthase [Lachnospiraceae bacterium]|nr:phosphoribosylformylglycinamidine synthase [Lachnospiraceae bacterium]
MVYRIYVEKKEELANEAHELLSDARTLLGITSLEKVRLLNRYDAEGIGEKEFNYAVKTVFSEPQTDIATDLPDLAGARVFAVEYLPGQFDQRADSAAQCIQIIYKGERPLVRSAKVYALYGNVSDGQLAAIKKYVINPVEAREAALEKPETLVTEYDKPTTVATLNGFTDKSRSELEAMISELGLAMDSDDIVFCREYFLSEHRNPTITELRMIDTYWSDHCRHTTFTTAIDNVSFEDKQLEDAYNHYLEVRKELGVKKPVCLMDIATVSVKYLKKAGLLDKLDESEEINACTVKLDVDVDGVTEPWLLLFKNETHNHPTEIEPFGGAATCIGGAIRDPLSGRSYVYGAMRVTGAADPLKPISETIPGKLSQRKLVTGAAAGYSSYGNQIGLATGIVDELYHPGYAAKRMEIGAVIAAAPAENVRRERPAPGDVVILLGGSTGRDGIGGATGSSKAHNTDSVKTCGAEVQKGNAPEERKLQRLFRNPAASKLIKRCNDFGAGGVSVAIGELADGLEIDLNAVPKKYEGLDGTELAISESQERMAVVVEAADEAKFLSLAAEENLQAVRVAVVQEDPRLVMNWNGKKIVDISREFLNSNGAAKHITIETAKPEAADDTVSALAGKSGGLSFEDKYMTLVSDLNSCSMRGLSERFDSTIGAGTVIMPFGGARQLSPSQAMVQKIPVEKKHTDTCSVMSWGYNPFITEKNCFRGAYLAVVESVAKLIASGAEFKDVYLTFQEYFAKPGHDPKRWGQPLSALLGAFEAQLALGIGAIGGKDSMSGTFEKLDVPPTLVSFAVTSSKTENIVTDDFKKAGHAAVRIAPVYTESGLPETASLKACFALITKLARGGKLEACYTPGIGGIAEAVFKMGIGNGIGFEYTDKTAQDKLFSYDYGAFIAELSDGIGIDEVKAEAESLGSDVIAELLGNTTAQECISLGGESISMNGLLKAYEDKLESVYSCNIPAREQPMKTFTYKNEAQTKTAAPAFKCAKPKVLIPAFPGTNCEFDSAKAAADAGCDPEIIVIRNLTGDAISGSIDEFAKKLKDAQMIFIPGGFSGGDEPDGSGKFITAFFRNEAIKEGVTELLEKRDGLMCGICNGFQALIKLGLVPYGKIIDVDENCPTLSFNTIARHQSRIVRTRIASNKSPWLALTNPGDIYNVPISHGEGRFLADEALIKQLADNGQIATQYVDLEGKATTDVHFNPNDSMYAIEGITSPDGRVFGKMGHSERIGKGLYRNVPGNYDIRMFEAAVNYYK